MEEGKEIAIIYDPENPQDVVQNSYWHLVFFPWLTTIIGFIAFSVLCLELLVVTNFI